MKHLLNTVAIAAVLAIAGPAWAQNPATPSSNAAGVKMPPPPQYNPATPGATGVGAPTSATMPTHHVMHHARVMHAHHKYMAHKAALSGDTTGQLNREELARIQSGGAPAAPPAGQMPPPAGQMPPHQ